MAPFLTVVAVNAVTATVLALAVAAASRGIRRPGIVHLLWLVVLADLVTPPLWPVGVVPRVSARSIAAAPLLIDAEVLDAGGPGTGAIDPTLAGSSGVVPTGTPAHRLTTDGSVLLLAVWLSVSLGLLVLAIRRAIRFRRLLGATIPAGAQLRRSAEAIALRLGLARPPVIRIVPARIPPMLLSRLGAPELLLPERLLARLGPGERDAVIAHELAHVRRRDHWVRFLELAAIVGFWWHPVVWWARSALRRYEERCCDGLVLRTLPGHARPYADSLVKTVEFLSRGDASVPALASGIRRTRDLEERLVMILKRRLPAGVSRTQRIVLALAAASLLVLFPTWADRDAPGAEDDPTEVELAQAEEHVREESLRLEREAFELETRLHEIRSMQVELRADLDVRRSEIEALELERLAALRDGAGLADQADELRAGAERVRRQVELERELRRLERDQRGQLVERRIEIQEMLFEAAAAETEGDLARAAELRVAADRLARDMELEAHAGLRARGELDQARGGEALAQARARFDRTLAQAHAGGAADSAEAELALARLYAEMARAEAENRDSVVARDLDKLRAAAEQLDAEGEQRKSEAIRRQIEELQRALDRKSGHAR